ncbi:hypothetical protein BX661DRAFT_39987 [Kickxella alabastrina]|uniref:uncharacterized protein n=1 Tax=Kickxella alabastrina TaxID=61397 RepID=UPI0022208950|nr:uncharacterized protein BX661DRAFT_39987 [Kickxella alabastrina]KAI7825571.1 hypothetical protein BX661DRAFT_39987 [Kickxella alabastrina]
MHSVVAGATVNAMLRSVVFLCSLARPATCGATGAALSKTSDRSISPLHRPVLARLRRATPAIETQHFPARRAMPSQSPFGCLAICARPLVAASTREYEGLRTPAAYLCASAPKSVMRVPESGLSLATAALPYYARPLDSSACSCLCSCLCC